MIHVENKENIPRNHITNGVQYADLGCYPLSESEDEVLTESEDEVLTDPALVLVGREITEEYLDQAERCLLDIENYETNEETKVQLINQLYQHIQLQRQGLQEAVPITYGQLKKQGFAVEEVGLPDSYLQPQQREVGLPDSYLQSQQRDGAPGEADEEDNMHIVKEAVKPEDIAIIKHHKTFAELLEEELAKEEGQQLTPGSVAMVTTRVATQHNDRDLMPPPPDKKPAKREFLKRGQGIARFNSAPMRKPQKPKTVMKPDSTNIPPPKRTVGIIRSSSLEHSSTRTNKLPTKIRIDDPLTIVPNKDPVKTCQSVPVMSPVRNCPTKSPEHSISDRLKPVRGVREPGQVPGSLGDGVRGAREPGSLGDGVNEISGFLNPEQVDERLAAEEEELEEFRMLEQAAANKSINSLIGMLKFTKPAASKLLSPTIEEEKEEKHEENAEDFEENDDFDDNETWGFRTPVKPSVMNNIDNDVVEGVHTTAEGEAKPSKLLSSLFPGLKPAPPPVQQKPTERKPDPEYDTLKLELKSKLAELEREVERFQQEAAGLARARTEKETELRRLREENEKYVLLQEEKEKKFQEYKDRELKMIRAEKKQFEMSQLSSRQRAAKLELVDNLTERVKALEEELSRKEEKWNTTFTRLKNRAEAKEGECSQLHSQIAVLEQEKLAMWEKEVERTSNKRHKYIQTEETKSAPNIGSQNVPNGTEVIKTEGMATTAESTIKPLLKARHPDIEWNGPSKNVQFSESESGYINLYHNASSSNQNTVSAPRDNKPANQSTVSTSCDVAEEEQRKHGGSKHPASETIGRDGSVTLKFSNGTVKHISADGKVVTMTYFNGDTKQTFQDGRVVYKFLKDGITQTQFPGGLEKTVFPTGQEETKYPDKRVEIKYPDKSTKITYESGEERSVYADGTVVTVDKEGQRLIVLPSGQREVHTSTLKRREYPDGTSKTVYNDGRQETIHNNGRRRRKDCSGTLVEDIVVDAMGNVIHDYLASKVVK